MATDSNDRLFVYSLLVGLPIIFLPFFYYIPPPFPLIVMILGAAVIVIPVIFAEYYEALQTAGTKHITATVDPQAPYKGVPQHWYFKTWEERVIDGTNNVIVHLFWPWEHPRYGKVWYLKFKMKGSFLDRFKFDQGVAARHGVAFTHNATDRAKFQEREYEDFIEFDNKDGFIPVYRLITAGNDDSEQMFNILQKYYAPKTEAEKQKDDEDIRTQRINEMMQRIKAQEAKVSEKEVPAQ